eukprot:2988321-Alexandrium_andersonii.AAC.1
MSASLVGSEMCIRDRVPSGPDGATSLLRSEKEQQKQRKCQTQGANGRCCLLYTSDAADDM